MNKQFKCPVCGESKLIYNRGFQGSEFKPDWYRKLICHNCGIFFGFIKDDYRKIKSLLFPEKKVCEWRYHGDEKTMGYTESECGRIDPESGKFCPCCGGEIEGE